MKLRFDNSRNRQKPPSPKPQKSVGDMTDKEFEKYNNSIVSAYVYDHSNGKSIQVSCPKRLLRTVQNEARLDLLKNLRLNPNV